MKEPYYKGYIASYEAYLAQSPYVREVAKRLLCLTEGARTMLDIGAGTGVFSLLTEPSVRVTAVEPSEAMCGQIALHSRAAERDIRIVCRDWETMQVADGAYDVVLCANAVYQMRPLDVMLRKMVRAARKAVLIVMNGRTGIGTYGKMRRALQDAGIACASVAAGHTASDVRCALGVQGITYDEETASWQDVSRFAGKRDALLHLVARYGVADADIRRAEEIFAPYIAREDDDYTITDDVTMTFITVRIGGQAEA